MAQVKLAIFDQYLAMSRKRYDIMPLLLQKANGKLYIICQTVPFSTTLSDPNYYKSLLFDRKLWVASPVHGMSETTDFKYGTSVGLHQV